LTAHAASVDIRLKSTSPSPRKGSRNPERERTATR
jgi:hypothetical protein